VGEHTIEILESLGYGKEAIADLLNRRVAMDPSMQQHDQHQAGS